MRARRAVSASDSPVPGGATPIRTGSAPAPGRDAGCALERGQRPHRVAGHDGPVDAELRHGIQLVGAVRLRAASGTPRSARG